LSYSNDMRKLIDIQDTNITFEEKCVQVQVHRGLVTKFIKAKLSYTPTHSSVCGVKNVDYTIYKNGTKTSNIKLFSA